jgi:SAM-dependent methyltransferase
VSRAVTGSLSDLARRIAHMRQVLATAVERAEASDATLRDALAALTNDFAGVEDTLRALLAPATALAQYRVGIDRFNAGQSNHALLDAIRHYNHSIIDTLDRIQSLAGSSLLDVGASPHGYALERALDRGARHYVGIGLDVEAAVRVEGPVGLGELCRGDAEGLAFDDMSFDMIVSMSTFEHILRVDRALSEMHRVVRPGGRVLLSFEPLWTCSYGHHLHHFGEVSALVPDWAHLMWTPQQMRAALTPRWPTDAPVTLDAAVSWVYEGDGLNRIGIRDMLRALRGSALHVEWIQPLVDQPRDPRQLDQAAAVTGLTRDELMTKGFSALLRRA